MLKDDLGISSFGIRRRLWRVIQEVQKELQQQEQVAVVDEVPVSAPALSDLQEQQPVVSQHNLSEKDLKSSVQTSHQSPIRAVATTNNISNSGSPSSSSTQLVAAKLLAINQLQPQILSKRKPIYEPVLYPRSGVSLKRPRPPPSIRKRPIHATVEVLSGKTQLSPSPNPRLIRDTDVYFFNNNNSSVFSKQQSSSSSSSSEIVPNTTSRIDNGCLIRESNNGQDFSFIRLQPTSSFPASPDGNNHFMDSQPLVHKKIQRMLLNNNLTIIKDTPRHFKATWKPPVVNEDVRRVFKVPVRTYTRVGDDEIEEMVTTGDRLGTSPANIKRIDKSRRQVYKCVPSAIRAGDAAVSKQQQNCLHFGHEDLDDSDPILP